MHDAPSSTDILAAVADFLREQAVPALGGAAAYRARVAANLLDIARRELEQAPRGEASELESLRALLGEVEGQSSELRKLLCQRIAAGEIDLHTPGLMDHLWRVTLDKLAVDRPDYDTSPPGN